MKYPPVRVVYIVQPMNSVTYCSGDECRGLKLLTYSYTIEPFNRSLVGSPLGFIIEDGWAPLFCRDAQWSRGDGICACCADLGGWVILCVGLGNFGTILMQV